jgi:hypothetical protein
LSAQVRHQQQQAAHRQHSCELLLLQLQDSGEPNDCLQQQQQCLQET